MSENTAPQSAQDGSAAPAAAAGPAETAPAPKADALAAKTSDDDLDDLDDLLDDFAEDVLSKPPGLAAPEADSTKEEPEEFKTRIEDLIKDLNIEDPETKAQFETLVHQFEAENKDVMEKPQNFDTVMKDTMERLKKLGETIDEQLKNDPSGGNPEDLLTQLLSGLGGAGGAGGEDFDMSKLLVDMLEQLSSKEVLYEPIKDLNTKFPQFLEEKKGLLPADEHANYTKQYELTNDILAVFEAPDYDDNDKTKRDGVNTLLELLQELGQPPSELVGEAGDFPGFGGLPGAGDAGGLNFSDKDLPKDFEKELEDGCRQQ